METLVRINKRGAVTLPKGVREQLQLGEGDALLVGLEGNTVMLRLADKQVKEYSDEDLHMFAREDELSADLAAKVAAFLRE